MNESAHNNIYFVEQRFFVKKFINFLTSYVEKKKNHLFVDYMIILKFCSLHLRLI